MTKKIVFTNKAKQQIEKITGESKSKKYFRISVKGGGCSGFQYGFKFDDNPAGDDDVVDFEGFTILLDSLSYPYLYGSTLDYVEDLAGSRFLVTNPNAKTTCGCGESFTT